MQEMQFNFGEMAMREIKFRAWDKEEATMHYPTANSFLGLVFGSDGKVWTPRVGGVLNGDTPIFMETKLIPMQYTGLHDKAGKEIYESDIVTWYINGKEETGTVVFDTGHFWIENVWNDWLRGEYEVKGNIYEDRQ